MAETDPDYAQTIVLRPEAFPPAGTLPDLARALLLRQNNTSPLDDDLSLIALAIP